MNGNILLLLVDQWPAWAFGFRGGGVATPAVDALAASGTVFEHAFTTCPLCTPARAALLTGRWAHQTGVIDNSAVGYSTQDTLPLEEQTWLDEAVRRGYRVAYFGKWHLGRINPEQRGAHAFDPEVEARALPYDPATNPYSYARMARQYAEMGERHLLRGRAPFWGEHRLSKEDTAPFPVAAKGIAFLREWAAGDRRQPFFLTVSSAPPHFPHHLPREYAELAQAAREQIELPANMVDDFAGKPWFQARPWWPCMDTSVLSPDEWRTVLAYSQAHIRMTDEALGRVTAELDRLGLTDSTTVVFLADHGDMAGAHNRFDKGPYFYEEVWRIPLIVRSPGQAAAVQKTFVSTVDVGTTLRCAVGAEWSPERAPAGRDLTPLLGTSLRPPQWPREAFGVYDLYNGMSFAIRAVRNERFKYVWNAQDVDELYDLAEDPAERRNRAGEPALAAAQAALRGRLLAWLAEVGDPFPDFLRELPPAGTVLALGRPGP
ncbi:MAG: sulfatase-like hydrolase/transferase [Lentisphaeria bacterium]|nr:sulfatase-like hydrolase/transferase [Lentisphaeria bacterium]